jgi:hypothetical protein
MKTEVCSWRLSEELKSDLEREAHLRKVSVSCVLETAVRDWLKKSNTDAPDDQAQRKLRTAAARCLGILQRPQFPARRNSSEPVRRRLKRRYTGAILALLDRTDRWHDSCVDAFQQLRLPLLTSEAVLTELFHLVGDTRSETEDA